MKRLPQNIMSARSWNTFAERNILMDLMELLLQAMEEDNRANVGKLDDYLMVFFDEQDDIRHGHPHTPLFKLPASKYDAVAVTVATAATVVEHLAISSAIL
jgi:hypothetical protein